LPVGPGRKTVSNNFKDRFKLDQKRQKKKKRTDSNNIRTRFSDQVRTQRDRDGQYVCTRHDIERVENNILNQLLPIKRATVPQQLCAYVRHKILPVNNDNNKTPLLPQVVGGGYSIKE